MACETCRRIKRRCTSTGTDCGKKGKSTCHACDTCRRRKTRCDGSYAHCQHRSGPFSCDRRGSNGSCMAAFEEDSQLRVHLLQSHSVGFKCALCGYLSISPNGVKKHFSAKHTMVPFDKSMVQDEEDEEDEEGSEDKSKVQTAPSAQRTTEHGQVLSLRDSLSSLQLRYISTAANTAATGSYADQSAIAFALIEKYQPRLAPTSKILCIQCGNVYGRQTLYGMHECGGRRLFGQI